MRPWVWNVVWSIKDYLLSKTLCNIIRRKPLHCSLLESFWTQCCSESLTNFLVKYQISSWWCGLVWPASVRMWGSDDGGQDRRRQRVVLGQWLATSRPLPVLCAVSNWQTTANRLQLSSASQLPLTRNNVVTATSYLHTTHLTLYTSRVSVSGKPSVTLTVSNYLTPARRNEIGFLT